MSTDLFIDAIRGKWMTSYLEDRTGYGQKISIFKADFYDNTHFSLRKLTQEISTPISLFIFICVKKFGKYKENHIRLVKGMVFIK